MFRHAVVVAGALGCATVSLSGRPAAPAPSAAAAHATTAREQAPPAPPDVGAIPADAVKSDSGLASKVLQPGTGDSKPGPEDFVTVHYTGWTSHGVLIDSSRTGGLPATFPVHGVIKGWGEGVQLMVVGEKRRLWIPEELAYDGEPGRPEGMVVFDVELVEVVPPPTTPPPDVAAPPADAKTTASGLAYKILRSGPGGARPTATSRVTVHYSGWTAAGKLFDSSIVRGQPATFMLGEVIDGWTEGVQLLSLGDKARFWIPEALAYQGGDDGPAGMLVFDIELLEVEDPGHARR